MADKKGFTLIEVIVVTLIIATLALLVAPSFKNSALTNQMEKAKIGLVELTTAVKLYNEVHPTNDHISGVLDQENFEKLTEEDEDHGYVYLQNSDRWGIRSGSPTEYSLWGGDGVLECRYTIGGVEDDFLSSAGCQFYDEAGNEECYNFSINRTNPAVIVKTRLDNCENI